jgi:hypothetical protein
MWPYPIHLISSCFGYLQRTQTQKLVSKQHSINTWDQLDIEWMDNISERFEWHRYHNSEQHTCFNSSYYFGLGVLDLRSNWFIEELWKEKIDIFCMILLVQCALMTPQELWSQIFPVHSPPPQFWNSFTLHTRFYVNLRGDKNFFGCSTSRGEILLFEYCILSCLWEDTVGCALIPLELKFLDSSLSSVRNAWSSQLSIVLQMKLCYVNTSVGQRKYLPRSVSWVYWHETN